MYSSVDIYCIDSLHDCYLSNYRVPVLDTGEFLQDHQHGQGKLRSPSYTYEGAWAMNRMHGRGTFSSGDGSTYTGHFLKGVCSSLCTVHSACLRARHRMTLLMYWGWTVVGGFNGMAREWSGLKARKSS